MFTFLSDSVSGAHSDRTETSASSDGNLDRKVKHTVTFLPSNKRLDIDTTLTLREAAHELGVNVGDQCGGMGACCNCIVTVVSGQEHFTPKTHLETPVFYLQPNERLSCQARITGNVVVSPRQ